ncbi:JHBP domain containing protein [Asbolus verrucosus]|uniref:JHBP domain containing protein n=1 Tax=Asbolus verrucosus TaxID=1661398 RepID=A0A482V9L8_ASBVE|nr:JHBP domain containing protein [Asbolus verrucosus]
MRNFAVAVWFLASVCTCAKLPPGFKKCDREQRDFDECVAKAAEYAIRQLDRPLKRFGLPSLEPLEIRDISVGPGRGAVAFEQNFTYLHVFELTNVQVTYTLNFELEEYVKNGKKFYRVADGKLVMATENLRANLKNLFDGDKVLEAQINKVINDNWELVLDQAKGSYEVILGKYFSAIFDNLLTPGFKTCNRHRSDFKECIRQAVEDAIRQLKKPMKEFGLPGLEPQKILNISIEAGTGPVAFDQNFTYFHTFGLTLGEVRQFDIDFVTETVAMECFFPKVTYEFEFSFNGTVMSLPLTGQGFGWIVMEKMTYNMTFKLERYAKHGRKFYRVADEKLVLSTKSIRSRFENLFDGDKVLGDRINKVINDNWDILFDAGKGNYEIIFGKYFAAMFDNVLARASIAELFGGP